MKIAVPSQKMQKDEFSTLPEKKQKLFLDIELNLRTF